MNWSMLWFLVPAVVAACGAIFPFCDAVDYFRRGDKFWRTAAFFAALLMAMAVADAVIAIWGLLA